MSDGAASEYFGYSVALSGDTALVGAPYRTVGAHTCQGAVYVFVPQLDTTGPTTVGMAASGRKGHAITLKYRVNDNLSPQATAVKLAVRNARGKVVKRFVLGTKKTATWYGIKWTPTSRGTYRYRITAKDLAGNAQVKVGGGKVSVR